MDVNFEYYKIFYYVAKYNNFTRAARVLGNSQPNVTRAMNCLEDVYKRQSVYYGAGRRKKAGGTFPYAGTCAWNECCNLYEPEYGRRKSKQNQKRSMVSILSFCNLVDFFHDFCHFLRGRCCHTGNRKQ